ncbi:unnamed protein product, partial [marine sediment metagenome]
RDNIMELRKKILATHIGSRPVVFFVTQINLRHDIHHCYPNPLNTVHMPRFYSYFNGMKFQRLGGYDGIRLPLEYKGITLKPYYWFHCHFKADMDHFLRSGLSTWEKLHNFQEFPSLESYMLHIAKTKYGTNDLKVACKIYMEKTFFPKLEEYDPKKYIPYSSHVLKNFK